MRIKRTFDEILRPILMELYIYIWLREVLLWVEIGEGTDSRGTGVRTDMSVDVASDTVFSALVATAVDGIVVIDADGIVQVF
ncbi:MAG TPA: hypothetical protein VMF58_13500, partial [Rhizomicrobium sp.]|nr:hypothetical protein [Rhizomicrobium sp.]